MNEAQKLIYWKNLKLLVLGVVEGKTLFVEDCVALFPTIKQIKREHLSANGSEIQRENYRVGMEKTCSNASVYCGILPR